MRKGIVTTLLVGLFFVNNVNAGIANMTVTIINLPPYVGPISATDPVKFSGNKTATVWCNATVDDLNGYNDIKTVNSVLWNPQTSAEYLENNPYNHYTPAYTLHQIINDTSKNVMSSFNIEPNSMMGIWTCKIKAVDSNLLVGERSKNITIYSGSCSNNLLDPEELMVDCGGVCPPCLTANDIFIQVRPGKSNTELIKVSSGTSQYIKIRNITKTSLSSGKGVIDSSNVNIGPYSFILNPYGSQEVYVSVHVPEWTETGLYTGNLIFFTNTTLSLRINITADTRRRGVGYMDLDVSGRCLDNITNITVIDERHYRPLENANVTIEYNTVRILQTKTDLSGHIQFIPDREGIYRITATKEGFSSESAFIHVILCGIPQTCSNGIREYNEEGIDCGGPCPPCHCNNGVMDADETGIDCGGSCQQCHCNNGVMDADETGIDCGGSSCVMCPEITYIPKLSIISQKEVSIGNNLTINVVDDDSKGVYSIIVITKPGGDKIKKTTDSNGYAVVVPEVTGRWEISAIKSGYMPDTEYVSVTEAPLIIVVKVTSYLIPLIILLIILYKIRKRTKIVVDDSSLQRLIEEDALGKYKHIYVTSETYNKFLDMVPEGIMEPVSLNEKDVEKSNEMSRDLGIPVEEAKLLVISEKLKAIRLIIAILPAGMEEFKGTKIVTIEQELT